MSPTRPRWLRGWLTAGVLVLLVGSYLVGWTTYTRLHLPPRRYDQRPPGVTAVKQGADFRLVSLRQSAQLVDRYRGPQPADPGAVWVVAEMEVTPHRRAEDFTCSVVLVGEDRTIWESAGLTGVSRATPSCPEGDVVPGRTYPIEVTFEVPLSRVDALAGVAINLYRADPDPLLTPAR